MSNRNNSMILSRSGAVIPRGALFRGTPRRGGTMGSMEPKALATQRVTGPADPVGISTDIIITKKFNKTATITTGTTVDLSPQFISGSLPSCVDRFRIVKISLYDSSQGASNSVAIKDLTTDLAQFEDFGTLGQMRAQIHIKPSFDLRQQWLDPASTTSLYTITGVNGQNYLFQLTLEVRTVP